MILMCLFPFGHCGFVVAVPKLPAQQKQCATNAMQIENRTFVSLFLVKGDAAPQENAEKNTNHAVSSNDGGDAGGSHANAPAGGSGLYPSLPGAQPNAPNPAGNNYPGAPNGYTPPNYGGGYMPPNYGSGYPQLPNNPTYPNYPSPNYPPPGYPAPAGAKDPSDKSGTFNSILNFLGGAGGNRGGSSSSGSSGPDFNSFLNLLGGRGGQGGSPAGGNAGGIFSRIDPGNSAGSGTHSFTLLSDYRLSTKYIHFAGGPDFRTLLNAFGGSGSGGSLENTAITSLINQFRNSGGNIPAGQPAPNNQYAPQNPAAGGQYAPQSPPSGQYAPSNPASNQPSNNDGSNFLSILGNLAKSQIANQLIQRAVQGGNNDDSVSNRRVGGVFAENPSSSGSGGYPTQAPYTPNYPTQAANVDRQRIYSANNNAPTGQSSSTEKPAPYGWNV